MAMATKGSRSITVDGVRYRFHASGADLGLVERSTVAVEAWEGGQRVVARIDPWILSGVEPEPYVSKKLVREVILAALARGWRPRSHGRQLTLDESALYGEQPAPRPLPEPLLGAILDEPESDAPRLVLADWLLEQGDRRGELIALQCAEAARTLSGEGRERLTRLLARHWRRWSAPVRPVARRWRFERGFVASLLCYGVPDRACWERLHALEPVEALELSRAHEQAEALEWLPQRSTRRLQLRGAIGDRGIAALLRSPNLGRLRELHCTSAGLGDDAAALLAHARLPALVTADLRYNAITAAAARELAEALPAGTLRV